jgi:hypothetical protein
MYKINFGFQRKAVLQKVLAEQEKVLVFDFEVAFLDKMSILSDKYLSVLA